MNWWPTKMTGAMPRMMRRMVCVPGLVALMLLAAGISAQWARAQEQPSNQPSQNQVAPQTSDNGNKEAGQAAPEHKSFGRELAQEEREATGAEVENANLKHSAVVQWLAKKTGLSVHATYLAALIFNFGIIVMIVVWAAFKFLPEFFKNRSAAIQRALEEARAASQDAKRRLSEVENRLRQLDVEIGQMQVNAEKEADAEEARIRKATEEEIRKMVQAAEQEIAIASNQARRELTVHTASLAVTLATKQIHLDSETDHMLVRTFVTELTAPDATDDDKDLDRKEGR